MFRFGEKSYFRICQYIFLLLFVLVNEQCSTNNLTSPDTRATTVMLLMQSMTPPKVTNVVVPIDTADTVVYAPNHNGIGFSNKSNAVNGVKGTGNYSGSGDVYSLSQSGVGAIIILEWSGRRITNGTGVDFIVFENPFYLNSTTTQGFIEPVIVEVSQDNVKYCGFSPTYTYSSSTTFSDVLSYWKGFAGITPVLYNIESNPLIGSDLYNLTKTGGDGFDLDNLVADVNPTDLTVACTTNEVSLIRSSGFVYLRLVSATARNFPANPNSSGGGPDIDGVIARYQAPR